MVIRRFIVLLLFLFVYGCDAAKDPKEQGAEALNKIEEAGREKALKQGKKLLKEDKDVIIDASTAKVCVYEGVENRKEKAESPRTVQHKFDGSFTNGTEIYASKLPEETKIYGELRDGTDYLIAETSGQDKVYRCEYYTEK